MPKTIGSDRATAILKAIRTEFGKFKDDYRHRKHHITNAANACVVCDFEEKRFAGSYSSRPECTNYPVRITVNALVLLYDELVRKRVNPKNRAYPCHVVTRKPDWRDTGADGRWYCAVCGDLRDGSGGQCLGPRLTEPSWPKQISNREATRRFGAATDEIAKGMG